MGLSFPRIGWKYLIFEWNDSKEEMDLAKKIANEVGFDFFYFEPVVAPSPSKKFFMGSDGWKALVRGGELFVRDLPQYEFDTAHFFSKIIKRSIEEKNTSMSDELLSKGAGLLERNDFTGAKECFLKALDADHFNAGIHNNLGVLYWEISDVENAILHFAEAVRLEPSNKNIVLNYMNILVFLNRKMDAMLMGSIYMDAHFQDEEMAKAIREISKKCFCFKI